MHVVRWSSVHVVSGVFFVENPWYLQQIGLVIRARADQKKLFCLGSSTHQKPEVCSSWIEITKVRSTIVIFTNVA